MKRTTRLLPALLLALLAWAPAASAADWEQLRDEDGIRTWKRALESSSLIEFRGLGVVKAPLLSVAAVLRNVERHKEWMETCTDSQVLRWISATHAIVYNRMSSPVFFVSDRDAVLEVELKVLRATRELLVAFKTVQSGDRPPAEGLVRVPDAEGSWRLTQIDGSTTEVEYKVHADPGGSIPHQFVNWASENVPFETIARLRAQVARSDNQQDARVLEQAIDWSGFIPAAEPAL